MVDIRPYQPEDYLKIQRRKFDLLTFLNFPNPKLMAENLARGPAFTGFSNGEIIASGGILPLWKGVGEAWVVSSELVCQYRLSFGKTIWRKLYSLIETMKLERIQTTVDAENIVSQRWVERMGFKFEGEMPKYIQSRTFIRYAWIKEE